MKSALHSSIFILAATLVAVSTLARGQDYDARARDIVSKMTLQEKIDQLHGTRTPDHRRYVPPLPRPHIPAMLVTNGPAGAGPGDTRPQEPATALPSPISLAATWDTSTARLYGVIAGRESRDLGNGLLEGPDVNIARVPQNGRTFEAFGEDPYLTSRIGVAEIEGIQSQHIIADVKHYDANNQESDRFKVNEITGQRTLHEIYLPAFDAAVHQAHVASVMCAYPKVDGTYNCQDDLLMNQILDAAVPEPPEQLKGFERVGLKPGQTGHLHMVVDTHELSYWNTSRHAWAVMPGAYKVMVGASSRDVRLQGRFSVN